MIGDDISIYLWQVDGKRAQIVIEAPKSVKIRRPSKEQDAADLMTMRQTERGER